MLLTPTSVGLLLAGAIFWCLLWAALHKLGELSIFREWLETKKCLAWIRQHQGLTLLMTETINVLLHGLSPAGIFFTFGGTVINVLFIFGYLPGRDVLAVISAKLRMCAEQ
jgi:hypothetical protein